MAQQLLLAELEHATIQTNYYWNDAWDGYPLARQRLLADVAATGVRNPVFLTCDWHSTFVNDLKLDFKDPAAKTVATEFVTPAITTGGDATPYGPYYAPMIPYNPHIQYYEGDRRGYFKATVTPAQMRLDLRFVTTVESPIAFAYTEKSWVVTDGVAGAINKVVPATKTTTTETPTSSTTTSSTSFVLVPGETVQVQESVGKKVEFTGTLIPAGNIRSGTTARTEREDAPDTKTRERIETKNSAAQFRVTSIKTIGAC